MCDLFSWVKKDESVYFMTDEDCHAVSLGHDVDWNSVVGHSALRRFFKLSGGKDVEGILKVPPALSASVNAGKCDDMAKSQGWAGIRYTKGGNINVPWWPKKLIKEASTLKYFDNHGTEKPEWKVFSARDAAWAAARDAALYNRCILAFYGDKENKHLDYARRRWEVYQLGYGVAAEVDGVFYVYRKP